MFTRILALSLALTGCGREDEKASPEPTVMTEALPVDTGRLFSETALEESCPALESFFLTFTESYLGDVVTEVNCEKVIADVFTPEEIEGIQAAEQISCAGDRACFKTRVVMRREEAEDRYYAMTARFSDGKAKSVIFGAKSNSYFLPIRGPEVPKGKLLHDNLSHLRRSFEVWLQK